MGNGMDIDGWSYLKAEVQGKINEMTDRSFLLRSTFPLVIKSRLKNPEENNDANNLVLSIMEMKSTIDAPWIGMSIIHFLIK